MSSEDTIPVEPVLVSAALAAADAADEESVSEALEALRRACGPKTAPAVSHASPSAASAQRHSTLAEAQELSRRRAVYTAAGRIYPRTSPLVTSMASFQVGSSSYYGPCAEVDAAKGTIHSSFDETERVITTAMWWKDSPPKEEVRDMTHKGTDHAPPGAPFPPLGFFRQNKDQTFAWNERYVSVLNMPDNDARVAEAEKFVREFSDAAVPIAAYVLANVSSTPGPVLHCGDITVEITAKLPRTQALFAGDFHSAFKAVSREFNGRCFAQQLAQPQLVVPFSIMVEVLGAKALVYPRLPVGEKLSTLAYGPRYDPSLLHALWALEDADIEAEGVAFKLFTAAKCKHHWMGRELAELKRINGPLTGIVHRSQLDNRLYFPRACHLSAPSVPEQSTANDYYLQVFRPEFVLRFQQTPLSFESCTHLQVLGKHADERERAEEVQRLMTYVIPQAAMQLSRDTRLRGIDWSLIERGGLSRFLHSWGINLRYLADFHAAIGKGPAHAMARAFTEVEIIARALKQHVLTIPSFTNEGIAWPHDVTERIRNIATAPIATLWGPTVWPAVVAKYPGLATDRWEITRVDWNWCVARMLALLGAQLRVNRGGGAQKPGAVARVVFTPRVTVPAFPPAPYGDGQVLSSTLKAKRYLRSLCGDSSADGNRAIANLYIQFLEANGCGNATEIPDYHAAEQRKREAAKAAAGSAQRVLGVAVGDILSKAMGLPSAGEGLGKVMYPVMGGGSFLFETSEAAMAPYGFAPRQRVQGTIGVNKGVLSVIVGVRGGRLWRHDAGAEGATECLGASFMELMCQYGFTDVDPSGHTQQEPSHYPLQNGLLVLESYRPVVEACCGYSPGHKLQVRLPKGGGYVTTILGLKNDVAYHLPEGSVGWPLPLRLPSDASVTALSQGPLRGYPVEITPLETLSPGVDAVGSFGLYVGLRATVLFGLHYRQVIACKKGPFVGQLAVVAGVAKNNLWAYVAGHGLVPLGETAWTIAEKHAPEPVGLLPCDVWHFTGDASAKSVLHAAGHTVKIDTSFNGSLFASPQSRLVPGSVVLFTAGPRCREVGEVVGVLDGATMVRIEGDVTVRPLTNPHHVVINEFRRSAAFSGAVDAPFRALLPCGVIATMDLSVSGTARFGLYHGQRLQIERFMGEQNVPVVVVGAFASELWVQRQHDPFVLPLRGAWLVDLLQHHGRIEAKGIVAIREWSDAFMRPAEVIVPSALDRGFALEHIRLFALPDGTGIGLDVRPASVAPLAIGTPLRKKALSNFVSSGSDHRQRHPVVVGCCDGRVYVNGGDGDIVFALHDPSEWEVAPQGPATVTQADDMVGNERLFEPFLRQLHCSAPRPTPAVGQLYVILEPDQSTVRVVAKEIGAELSAGASGVVYDQDGAFDLSTMSYRRYDIQTDPASGLVVTERTYVVELMDVVTMASFVSFHCGARLAWARAVVAQLEVMAAGLIRPELHAEREAAARDVGEDSIVYFQEDVRRFEGPVLSTISDLLRQDLFRASRRFTPRDVNEFVAFHRHLQGKALHGACAFALSLGGLDEEDTRTHFTAEECIRGTLELIMRATGACVGVVIAGDEYRQHIGRRCLWAQEDETAARAGLLERYAAFSYRISKDAFALANSSIFIKSYESIEDVAVRAPTDVHLRHKRVREEIADMFASHASLVSEHATQHEAARTAPPRRFTLSDASCVYLAASDVSFSHVQGDVVRYGAGDIAGSHATILGFRDGSMWRCEHDGDFAGVGVPFEGDEVAVRTRFGLTTVTDVPAQVISGNALTTLSWRGEDLQLDVSFERCLGVYGVAAGQRVIRTPRTPDELVYDGPLVVLGVAQGQLWFATDLCGAIPFPVGCTDPVADYHLQTLYTAPVHLPPPRAKRLARTKGAIPDSERRFLDVAGLVPILLNRSTPLIRAMCGGTSGARCRVATPPDPRLRRAAIVGTRQGHLYVMFDLDSHATALPPHAEIMLLPDEAPAALTALALPEAAEAATAVLFPLPQGGLGQFSLRDIVIQYGLRAGDRIEWGSGQPKTSVVLGVRKGCLWRIDDGEAFARPFQGMASRDALSALRIRVTGHDDTCTSPKCW